MKIACAFPDAVLGNEELSVLFPEWSAEKIFEKTGIRSRRIVSAEESVADLAERAGRALFEKEGVNPQTIDFVLLCTQSPIYKLPPTACVLQHRLGIPTVAGALDYDLGCSGFVYGLSLAKGLVVGGMAKNVLLLTAETYSKYLAPADKTTRTIFGDGAAAVLVDHDMANRIGAFSFGTDGAGAEKLIVRDKTLFMDGPEIFNFTLDVVPKTMNDVLFKNGIKMEDVDLFVFHQANKFMLNAIRKINLIPRDKFYIDLEMTGNTVSSTIPIALKQLSEAGRLQSGMKVMVMGFGVGLSWGATILKI